MGKPEDSQALVSIVVVNHNRAALLDCCLQSLSAQTYRNIEVIVVDNASDDDSLERVRSLEDRRIEVVELPDNRGFTGGANAGIRRSRGEWVALINNDAEADPMWIELMLRAVREGNADMCAAKILFRGTDIIDKCGHLIFIDGQNRGQGTGERDRGQYDSLREVLFPDGCAALYSRRLLEATEGFDEDFFAYADDADLGLRARRLGFRCAFAPGAVVYHRHSATLGRFAQRKVYWIERNRIWLALKNLPWPLLLLMPLTTPYRWAWNVVAALLGHGSAGGFRREGSISGLAAAIVRASWDGWRNAPRMLKKRRAILSRGIPSSDFLKLLFTYRISARRLAWSEFRGSSS